MNRRYVASVPNLLVLYLAILFFGGAVVTVSTQASLGQSQPAEGHRHQLALTVDGTTDPASISDEVAKRHILLTWVSAEGDAERREVRDTLLSQLMPSVADLAVIMRVIGDLRNQLNGHTELGTARDSIGDTIDRCERELSAEGRSRFREHVRAVKRSMAIFGDR